ncbi:tetratricopeptide repeat protein 12-like, partial [Condylostylus longicornis]|uniref:tetratricopeptide repeat protein 12-like n=1 Tax=Condylostylus longicornis TaxID=2530218 RepID=UPI00244E4B25
MSNPEEIKLMKNDVLQNIQASDKDDEKDFEIFQTKVEAVQKILEQMNSPDQNEQIEGLKEADRMLGNVNDVDNEDSFIVKYRDDRTVINKAAWKDETKVEMDQFTFMRQVEEDAKQRTETRRENEMIANNFRQLGNEAFRKQEYEKAINHYTKAIDHVKDSPILYCNRALTYIKLKLFKRAINDCDFVVNKLDEKNLRSWLYRATAYLNLHDDQNYEMSIKMAKKNNSKEIEYIDDYVQKLKLE